jgi:hypothetical protein
MDISTFNIVSICTGGGGLDPKETAMSPRSAFGRMEEEKRVALGLSWRAIDLSNRRFGKLTAVTPVGQNKQRSVLWLCECECGGSHTFSAASLQAGRTNSCGCARSPAARARIIAGGGPWNAGKSYQNKSDDTVFRSVVGWREAVLRRFGDACQECGWAEAPCDVHHRVPRSEGGRNVIANGIVLCPNHHRLWHARPHRTAKAA